MHILDAAFTKAAENCKNSQNAVNPPKQEMPAEPGFTYPTYDTVVILSARAEHNDNPQYLEYYRSFPAHGFTNPDKASVYPSQFFIGND